MTLEELQKKAAFCGIDLDEYQLDQFDQYAGLLIEWNQKMNLTAITEYGDIVEKHFYDCILPLKKEKIHGKTADVGSGAGFPGIVWKIIFPSLDMTLIEPTGKRCIFLQEVISLLSLKEVTLCNERAEDHVRKHREEYDVVTARAVASLPVLAELAVPLVKTGGCFIAMKGPKGKEETIEAENALRKLGASVSFIQEDVLTEGGQRINIFIHKDRKTPSAYPRNYGQIKKKPL